METITTLPPEELKTIREELDKRDNPDSLVGYFRGLGGESYMKAHPEVWELFKQKRKSFNTK